MLTPLENYVNILNLHTAKRIVEVRNKPAPWLNSEIKNEMFTGDFLTRKAVKSGSQNDWLTYKKARNRVNYPLRCVKSKYYHHGLSESEGDSKTT